MAGNNLALTLSFQEKIKERIRESMGDLISDEDLESIVRAGIDDVFFTTRFVDDGRYNKKEIPPLINTMVAELLTERMNMIIREWLKEHEEEVLELVNQVVADGAANAMMRGFNFLLENTMNNMVHDIGRNLRR